MRQIQLNEDQRLYVLPAGDDGWTCLGFEVAREDANHMLEVILRHDKAGTAATQHPMFVTEAELGTMQAYEKYQRVHDLWRNSRAASNTYFGPGTLGRVRTILERYRYERRQLRLWYGDPVTGHDWCEENDVVGRIGRSWGPVKVPLLIGDDETGGPSILTDRIVRLMDVDSGRELYRAPSYQAPSLSVCADQRPGKRAWCVTRDGEPHANFDRVGDAHAYVAFMHGATSRPYCLQQ